MANPKRDVLRAFLAKTLEVSMVDEIMGDLEPFYGWAEQDHILLATVGQAADIMGEIQAAVASVRREPEARVLLVSTSQPFPKPEWMSDRGMEKCLFLGLDYSVGEPFWRNPYYRYTEVMRSAYGAALVESLLVPLVTAFLRSFPALQLYENRKRMQSEIGLILTEGIGHYLGYAYAKDELNRTRCRPVVHILGKGVFPLGSKGDDSKTWLVFVG